MSPVHAVVPLASTTRSHDLSSPSFAVPIRSIRPSSRMIVSARANGSRQSPVTIVAIFTIAVLIILLDGTTAQKSIASATRPCLSSFLRYDHLCDGSVDHGSQNSRRSPVRPASAHLEL